jgi:hypothetical protein
MYKTKPRFGCVMPSDARLNVLALNGVAADTTVFLPMDSET